MLHKNLSPRDLAPPPPSDARARMQSAMADYLLTEGQLAARWALASAKKLQADRLKGGGCPFVKIGRSVRYRLSDVLAYETANLRTSTSEG